MQLGLLSVDGLQLLREFRCVIVNIFLQRLLALSNDLWLLAGIHGFEFSHDGGMLKGIAHVEFTRVWTLLLLLDPCFDLLHLLTKGLLKFLLQLVLGSVRIDPTYIGVSMETFRNHCSLLDPRNTIFEVKLLHMLHLQTCLLVHLVMLAPRVGTLVHVHLVRNQLIFLSLEEVLFVVGHVLVERLLENGDLVIKLAQLVIEVSVVLVVFLFGFVNYHPHVLRQVPVLFCLPVFALRLTLIFTRLVSVWRLESDFILVELLHQQIQLLIDGRQVLLFLVSFAIQLVVGEQRCHQRIILRKLEF